MSMIFVVPRRATRTGADDSDPPGAGEQVITQGAFGLPDKTKVKVEAPPAAGDEWVGA